MGDEGGGTAPVFGGSAGEVGRGVVECGVGGEGLVGGVVEGDGGVAVEAGSGAVGDEPVASVAGGVDDAVTPEAEVEVASGVEVVEVVASGVEDSDVVEDEVVAAVVAEPVPAADEAGPTEFFAPVSTAPVEDVKPQVVAPLAGSDPEATKFFAPPVTASAHADDQPATTAPEPEPAAETTRLPAPAAEATEFFAPVARPPAAEALPTSESTQFLHAVDVPPDPPAAERPETFLTAEAMEFFTVPATEAKPAESPETPVATPVASTFGVPRIFRAIEPTEFLTPPEPADEPVEPPKVVRDPDDAETVVFAGVLDLGELDEPTLPPPPVKTTARQKNNPAVLTGVLTMVLCSVLGLGLISRIDNATPVAGHPIAAPFTETPAPASAEPVRPRAVQRLEDHPLLVNPKSLPEITCDLPKFSTSDDQLAAYYAAGVKCLDAAWGPVLKEANLPFEPPSLDASPELSDGPCGAAPASEDAVAYYCGRNRMIYMPTGRLRENGGGDRPATHLATLAHEYGHHVQAMSGMLRAADVKIVNAGEKTPAGLEMSRRIELQANCFAGMFLGAVAGKGSISRELANRAEEDFQYAMEESPEKNAHGSPVNQGNWALSGFDANTTDACNTYSAPAAEVG